ncbi:MAG: hypothetical protein A3J49_19410 [Gallionellales bacterium RIFCSPHIGHO2_02_FULL_57_16]|nr:MAG: hypothetical protein A3J49_19410 [Gallionellales bacterium RIFCSPHIGHO2_02_FULL_57_16]
MRFTFDRIAEFCQAACMHRTIGKFIAVILAIWLPLFSGNALAASIAMQAMTGDCHSAVAQQEEPHKGCASAMQQHHAQLDAKTDQSAGHHDRQNADDENCGTCHLACCGYMVTASAKAMEVQPSARMFATISSQFQSITSTPLDPPPLARA